MSRKILLAFCLFLAVCTVKPQGLAFNSTASNILQRTSYTVFAKSQPTFHDSLTVSFNLNLKITDFWGYIANIQDINSKLNVSLLYTIDNANKSLSVNYDNSTSVNQKKYPLKGARDFKIVMKFDFRRKSLLLSINQDKYLINNIADFKTSVTPTITFGKKGQRIDVPDFSINSLNISDKNQKYVFSFKEFEGSQVYDTKGERYGKVENPIWLIRNSYHWEKVFTHKSTNCTGYSFLPDKNTLIIVSGKSLLSHNFETNSTNISPIKNNINFKIEQGMSMYFPKLNKLNFYEIRHSSPNETNVVELLNGNEFISKNSNSMPSRMHHHAVYTDTISNLFYTFGGFGDNKYYNQLYCYNPKTESWSILNLNGDKINSRYFCSMGSPDNKKLYVFGGMGNELGSHTMDREYYYDLNEIDLASKTVKKKWEFRNKTKSFVSGRNLVFLKEFPSYFYTISYTEYEAHPFAKLIKWSLSDGNMEVVGDSIPVCSESIWTNAYLAVDNKSSKLYCVVQEYVDKKDENTISVYQISTPPVSISELKNNKNNKGLTSTVGLFILIAGIIIIFSLILIIYFAKRKKQKTISNQAEIDDLTIQNSQAIDIQRKNAIYLFGNFTIYDNKGLDISHLFSNKIRQLFLLILMKSFEGDGMTAEEIHKALWPDKDSADCKNLRGVMISKIRALLDDIDGISLNFNNSKYILMFDTPLYCDLNVFNSLIYSKSEGNVHIIEEDIIKLKQLLSRGDLLKKESIEQIETLILEYASKTITILLVELDFYFKKHQYQTVIQLSTMAQHFDKLNIKTLTYRIQSLNKLKRENDILKTYAFFCLEFKKQNNVEFSISLNQLLNQEL
jgi:uncharacterized membrane protein